MARTQPLCLERWLQMAVESSLLRMWIPGPRLCQDIASQIPVATVMLPNFYLTLLNPPLRSHKDLFL
jgi:hypothetical protein